MPLFGGDVQRRESVVVVHERACRLGALGCVGGEVGIARRACIPHARYRHVNGRAMYCAASRLAQSSRLQRYLLVGGRVGVVLKRVALHFLERGLVRAEHH